MGQPGVSSCTARCTSRVGEVMWRGGVQTGSYVRAVDWDESLPAQDNGLKTVYCSLRVVVTIERRHGTTIG